MTKASATVLPYSYRSDFSDGFGYRIFARLAQTSISSGGWLPVDGGLQCDFGGPIPETDKGMGKWCEDWLREGRDTAGPARCLSKVCEVDQGVDYSDPARRKSPHIVVQNWCVKARNGEEM